VGWKSSLRNIIKVKAAIHAMFMASAIRGASDAPHLHGMSWRVVVAHLPPASAAETDRLIARH
jgi:hypothetical protein